MGGLPIADCFAKVVTQKDLENQLRSFHSYVEARLTKRVQWRLGIVFDHCDPKRDAALVRDFFAAAKASQYGFDQMMIFTAVNRVLRDMLLIIGDLFSIICRMLARAMQRLLTTRIFNRKKLFP